MVYFTFQASGSDFWDALDPRDLKHDLKFNVLSCLSRSSSFCRDLKIENFLLDEHNNIKIVGMSACLSRLRRQTDWQPSSATEAASALQQHLSLSKSFAQTLAWATRWRPSLCLRSSSTPSAAVPPTRPPSCWLTGSTDPKWMSGLCKWSDDIF